MKTISLAPLIPALLMVAALACTDNEGGSQPSDSVDAGSTSLVDAADLPDATAPCVGENCPPQGGSDPGEPGPFASSVGAANLSVNNSEIALTIFKPDAVGPLPVVIFSHGFQLSASDYASYGEHLASWGYIVVMPDFPGGLIGGPNHRELKVMLIALIDWVDENAVLANGPLAGNADANKIALAGHSMGGKISLLVASEDARPVAVFGLDPVDAGGGPLGGSEADFPSVTPALMPQIAVPLVLLGETVNATGGLGGACAPAADNFHQYYLHAESKALEVEIVGANHMSFLDDPNCGFACSACPAGSDEPSTTRKLSRRYMTAFFQVFLKSQEDYRSYLTGDAMNADVLGGLVLTDSKNGF